MCICIKRKGKEVMNNRQQLTYGVSVWLVCSRGLYEQRSFKDSINRSYYAMFSAMRALPALDGVDLLKYNTRPMSCDESRHWAFFLCVCYRYAEILKYGGFA